MEQVAKMQAVVVVDSPMSEQQRGDADEAVDSMVCENLEGPVEMTPASNVSYHTGGTAGGNSGGSFFSAASDGGSSPHEHRRHSPAETAQPVWDHLCSDSEGRLRACKLMGMHSVSSSKLQFSDGMQELPRSEFVNLLPYDQALVRCHRVEVMSVVRSASSSGSKAPFSLQTVPSPISRGSEVRGEPQPAESPLQRRSRRSRLPPRNRLAPVSTTASSSALSGQPGCQPSAGSTTTASSNVRQELDRMSGQLESFRVQVQGDLMAHRMQMDIEVEARHCDLL
jgi:hypothetical protein